MNFQKVTNWYLLSIPIVAGLATLEFRAGDFTFTGLVWVAQAVVGMAILTIGFLTRSFQHTPGAWLPWVLWCGWIWLSLLWRENSDRHNLQEATQLCMPVLIGLIAAAAIRTRQDLTLLLRMFGITFAMLLVYSLLVIKLDGEWIRERIRPAALTAALLGCVFMGSFPRRFWLPLIGWAACMGVTVVTESRMATAVLLLVPVLHPGYRSKFSNLSMATAVAVLAIALFYTPVFQERFFDGGSGTLADVAEGQFSGAGRFDAWPYIKERAWQRPILGWGIGSAYEFVPTVWDETFYPHNDYLRLFFESGAIGLTLFVVAGLWQLGSLYRRVQRSEGVVRTAFTGCWLGFCALFISCATDNTILYNIYYTNLLFAVMGGAYGVAWAERYSTQESISLATDRWSVPTLPRLGGFPGHQGIRFDG